MDVEVGRERERKKYNHLHRKRVVSVREAYKRPRGEESLYRLRKG